MQTVTLMSAFVLAAVVLLTAPPAADAVCCKASHGYCQDGTKGTPYCGYHRCNIFGCSCGGGCRVGYGHGHGNGYGKRDVDEMSETETAEELVIAGDLNGDGLLSIEEAETMLEQGPNAAHRRSVRSLDKDMDGMLSVDEIDN